MRAFFSVGAISSTTGSTFTPAYFQNFDALTPGASAGFNSFNFATVSTTEAYSGLNSAASTIASAGNNFGGSQALSYQPTVGNQLWFRAALFYPTGFSFQCPGGGHLKLFRIDTGPVTGSTHAHLDMYLFNGGVNTPGYLDFIYEGLPTQGLSSSGWMFGGGGATTVPFPITMNAWNWVEVYYLLGLTAGTSAIKMWVNGTNIIDTQNNNPSGVVTNMATLAGSSYVAGYSGVGGAGNGGGYMWHTYWNGGAPQAQTGYLDNFTVGIDSVSIPVVVDVYGNKLIGTGAP